MSYQTPLFGTDFMVPTRFLGQYPEQPTPRQAAQQSTYPAPSQYPCNLTSRTSKHIHPRCIAAVAAIIASSSATTPGHAQPPYFVNVVLHEAKSLTNDDGGIGNHDDIYWKVHFNLPGSTNVTTCDSIALHQDEQTYITPEWVCSFEITSTPSTAPLPLVNVTIELWEHDGDGEDDHFDINLGPSYPIELTLDPNHHHIQIHDAALSDELSHFGSSFTCATGRITSRGNTEDDYAQVSLSITGAFDADGDTDGDGFPDSSEICGIDSDADGVPELPLPVFGSNPYRKDVFVEIDWFIDDDGGGVTPDHSHEPWLPALITAWNTFNEAPITNSGPPGGTPTKQGIALHLDVGTLFANYDLDFNNDGLSELDLDLNSDNIADLVIPPDGNIDLDGDGITDIGDLGLIDPGGPEPPERIGGGNRICADGRPAPCGPTNTGEAPILSMAAGPALRNRNFHPARNGVFRYAIFGHQVNFLAQNCDSTSGVAGWGTVDFVVTLAQAYVPCTRGWGTGPAGFLGPSGLAIDGSIAEHAASFLHELGHTIGLDHGGRDNANYKPNYHSVMNYTYSCGLSCGIVVDIDQPPNFVGDALPTVDVDGLPGADTARFTYSERTLPKLDEANLEEPRGVGENRPIIILYGPSALDLNSDGNCDVYCGTSARTWLANDPVDWSRGDNGAGDPDGNGVFDSDLNVNSLSAPPPGVAPTPTDLNAAAPNAQPGITELEGFNDHQIMYDGGLALASGMMKPGVGVSREEVDRVRSSVRRVRAFDGESFMTDRCTDVRRIDFEETSPNTILTTRYGPTVVFDDAAGQVPKTAQPVVPTQSGSQALRNEPGAGTPPVPLGISFSEPQRFVALYMGRETPGDPSDDLAELRAFDTDGLPMGVELRNLPDHHQGIVGFMGLAAIIPDQKISRLELVYKGNAAAEPVHIDDLLFCSEQKVTGTVPVDLIPTVNFGSREFELTIDAVVLLRRGQVDQDLGHSSIIEQPLDGVLVSIDGNSKATVANVSRPEGAVVELSAPGISTTGLRFLQWRMNDKVSFGRYIHTIDIPILQTTKLTAIYDMP